MLVADADNYDNDDDHDHDHNHDRDHDAVHWRLQSYEMSSWELVHTKLF